MKTPLKDSVTVKEFDLTDELRELKFQRIAKIGTVLRVEYDDKPIVVKYDIENIYKMLKDIRNEAEKIVIDKGVTKPEETIDKLSMYLSTELLGYVEDNIATIGGSSVIEEGNNNKIKKQYIQKYFSKNEDVLYEAVLIAGRPYFVYLEEKEGGGGKEEEQQVTVKQIDRILLPDAQNPTLELLPPEKEMYLSKAFEFSSEKELNEYLKLATNETLDTLYRRQKNIASKYIDANNTHLTILAADSIFTYFQDRQGQTHYLMYVGDNDTGKTANLTYLQYTGYRAMLDIDITPANIYSFLGKFEEGQGIILEDEADDIDRRPEKMKIYKAGYNAGKKVTRTDITGFGRNTQSWNTFCFKAFTAEQAPDSNTAKGFIDRTFIFHCIRGDPAYDIAEITNPAGDNEHTELLEELEESHKLLFAFRLLHFQDPLPNIELSVKGREKQLCKPLLRLFQDSECKEEIGMALADLIGQKRGLKRDTLEAKILDVVTEMIAESEKEQAQRTIVDNNNQLVIAQWRPNQIPSAALFGRVCNYLAGTYKRPEDKSFDTEEHGAVSHTHIGRICIDKFGAEAKRTNSTRFFEFNRDRLDKAKSAYVFPEKVEILRQKNVIVGEIEEEEIEEAEKGREPEKIQENNVSKSSSDVSDVNWPPTSEREKDNEANNGISTDSTAVLEPQRESTSSFNTQENSLNTFKQENTSQASPHYSEEIFQLADDSEETNPFVEVAKKARQYKQQGGQGDYFTKEDFVYTLIMVPNERWTEDKAEQIFYTLLKEGKLKEIKERGTEKHGSVAIAREGKEGEQQ